ncbi:TetR/AcrR family transcriptional regulator [Ornithinibacillus halotolerans]|uniref:TetR family transcriptional regulator n=1 Tax=Ornithinibacillus halotolerans TaxID=1274357 RepID=A0A916W3C2_9BACI|nr:TetR/AcrR family transcriptional regulator [Ornithinibacillus halotolerans]GGA64068.1 TetR family transcriptional regulator [Ornithinibacillus halotolerans]
MEEKKVLSSVKDEELIKKRRDQMIKGALTLFKEKGFHKTTTREIAKESGFSIGTLYEYIRTKEDVLFLVCESIHGEVLKRLEHVMERNKPSAENLGAVISSFFRLMDEMQEEILILYQEVKSLSKETRSAILQKEKEMALMLEKAITASLPNEISKKDITLLANNIMIQGHMWGFRRWMLQKEYTLDEYIEKQIHFAFLAMGIHYAK